MAFEHEILVELFRNRPEIARELLWRCCGTEIGEGVAEAGPVDLSQVVSTEYRADNVVVVRDAEHAAVGAVIVEVQRTVDANKHYSWPLYVAALRAKLRCPVVLLVIAPSRRVARWARRRIETGHAGFSLQPLVVDFKGIPRVTDMQLASRLPELAVLSAMAHAEEAIGAAALVAIRDLPDDEAALYFDLIADNHPVLARLFREVHMKGYEYRSDVAKEILAEGREQGREQGLEQGREQGLERGREEAAIELAKAKLATFSEADEAAIRGVPNADLIGLIVALGRAKDQEEARAILDRLAIPTS